MPRVLWFLLLLVLSLAAPAPRQNCPDKCGNVPIPYPFGIGEECSRPGEDNFTVSCENGSIPYFRNMEIVNISLEAGEIRVYGSNPTYVCLDATSGNFSTGNMSIDLDGSPFLLSAARNVFTAVGCNAIAGMTGRAAQAVVTGCITYCASVDEAQQDNAKCSGLGCCEASITPGLTNVEIQWRNDQNSSLPLWRYNPCTYAMVAERDWYSFKREHLSRYMSLVEDLKEGVPVVLDWTIRNNGSTCHSKQQHDDSYACVSNHSYCVNTTNGQGYLCNCTLGYAGNPYIPGGCKNIDECELRISNPNKYKQMYPCNGGTCHDKEGYYNCKCKFGYRGDGKNNTGCQPILPQVAIASIGTVCCISILVTVSMFICMVHKKKRMEQERQKLMDSFNKNGGELLKKLDIRIFSKEELDQITENYSTIVGKGSFGEVYKGTIVKDDQHQQVVVKRSYTIDEARKEDFTNEVNIQCQIRHKNIVKLLGCCLETDVPMLVYEYISKGSLYDVLHGHGCRGGSNINKSCLPLHIRLDIAIYSAEALVYLHSHVRQRILHGDIKPANILLDDSFVPKVSDFGISKVLSPERCHTMLVIGDTSYIDPVYMKTGLLTEKSDVYSFGIVLLELITGKEARYNGNHSLPIDFVKSYKANKARDEMFVFVRNDDVEYLEKVGGIALDCLEDDVDKRPSMEEVRQRLTRVKEEFMGTS